VLDGTGNTDGNVQFGSDNFACLTDLHIVWYEARINCSP